MKLPVFIDFEASSLRVDSYPIEVAWNNQSGTIHSFLINPSHYPDDWNDWDPRAEALHGLTREYLKQHGQPPVDVARQLQDDLPKTLYSDAPDFDAFWLDRLFISANIKNNYIIKDATVLLERLDPDYYRYHDIARRRAGKPHRAAQDVAYLVNLYTECSDLY